MHITMDVVFHEDSMYFSSESELQGEYHKEIQTLDYDYHISEEDESGQSELVNQETGELDMSGQQFGSEDVFTEIPNQSSSVEGVLSLEPDPFMKRLPHHHNKGCMVLEKQCQKVCKLKKSLYGLKQSLRAWFGRFTKSMRAFGYCQITGNDPKERKALQNYLSREFEMKNLGPLKYFLGIEVSRSSERIFLSQRKHVLDLLWETGMLGCQPVNTPIEEGLKLCVEPNQVSTDKGRYQRLVGRLMYLAHTRLDIVYALSVVSQYMHNPGEQHMNVVMHILRYLKNAPGNGILFTKNVDHQSIEVYTDADWAGAVDDRRSTSDYFTFVGGNLMTWTSKKQNVVTRSSVEAEFRGMTFGLCEALWLRLLLQDLGYLSRQPIRLFCDNKAGCDIAHNPVQHDRTKHVEVDRFFIKEKLDDKIVELPKIRSKD
ncbi:Retrovirus-related Pol polyprotein from transposon RE1 [Vitis vinifera]|uniref:Retrovirus-related Pol polyprotein from transposon RE1 n=1 Tax=Vitis vinifera TaxID=29760 RepID=A0A438GP55_VITVI|nr:Retrovirus-related Pol polyprotein from transposon RE1 [Vitis vinifera]